MNVLLLSGDLMVASRVEGAAARIGLSLRTVSTDDQAATACANQPNGLLIVDLSTAGLDVAALIAGLTAMADRRPKTIAFGPHVHESLLSAAREAGCDEVISRGQFFAQLDEILRRAGNERKEPSGG
jgi:DNA-binding response OmpR family regulator